MIYKHLTYGIALGFISFLVGMIINAALKKTNYYQRHLSHLNFIRSKSVNRLIGLGVYKWIIKNSPLKFFNQKLQIKGKIDKSELINLRAEMTSSEIDHLIGFVFVSGFAIAKILEQQFLAALIITLVNSFMNLYPSLLQQENKRRIDAILKKN